VTVLLAGAPAMRVRGRRIAVMPFTNASNQPAVDLLSDGIGEEVVAALRDLDGIVVAPVVPFTPDAPDLHLTHVRRQVRADLILFGEVRQSSDGATLTASASLFDTSDGRRIWSGSSTAAHCCNAAELGGAVRSIVAAIAGALGVRDRALGCRAGDELAKPFQHA